MATRTGPRCSTTIHSVSCPRQHKIYGRWPGPASLPWTGEGHGWSSHARGSHPRCCCPYQHSRRHRRCPDNWPGHSHRRLAPVPRWPQVASRSSGNTGGPARQTAPGGRCISLSSSGSSGYAGRGQPPAGARLQGRPNFGGKPHEGCASLRTLKSPKPLNAQSVMAVTWRDLLTIC
jgi:hypothetical protein